MVWSEIEEEENLDGLSEEQKETFRERAVPVPGGVLREAYELTNDARRDIPSTLICTGVHRRAVPEVRARSSPWRRSSPASPSCATPPGSTCRRATGRCGRARPSSPQIIGEVAQGSRGRRSVSVTDGISARQFRESEGVEDWRVLADGAYAFFRTESFSAGSRLVGAIGELPASMTIIPTSTCATTA